MAVSNDSTTVWRWCQCSEIQPRCGSLGAQPFWARLRQWGVLYGVRHLHLHAQRSTSLKLGPSKRSGGTPQALFCKGFSLQPRIWSLSPNAQAAACLAELLRAGTRLSTSACRPEKGTPWQAGGWVWLAGRSGGWGWGGVGVKSSAGGRVGCCMTWEALGPVGRPHSVRRPAPLGQSFTPPLGAPAASCSSPPSTTLPLSRPAQASARPSSQVGSAVCHQTHRRAPGVWLPAAYCPSASSSLVTRPPSSRSCWAHALRHWRPQAC